MKRDPENEVAGQARRNHVKSTAKCFDQSLFQKKKKVNHDICILDSRVSWLDDDCADLGIYVGAHMLCVGSSVV